ncbi:MAG: sugar kinase [Phycisphaerales bacterium]|nr:sugar kinase [Hyphomonadaceae bacterium]
MARILCFGEILLRLSAPARELMLQTPRLESHVGGAEANVAVSLARFGHQVRMASIVPDNALGHHALSELRRWGVDVSDVKFGDGRMGLYFLTPGAGSRPSDVLYDRADSAFARASRTAINWDQAPENTDWLHVSGITAAVSEQAAEAALMALRIGRSVGARTSFDANFRAKLWEARGEDSVPVLHGLFFYAMLLFADARDIALVTGEQPKNAEDAARIAFERYPHLSILASTERKVVSADHHELTALLFTKDGGAYRSRTHTLRGIVDRIGGGDAFAAGVIHGLWNEMSFQEIADFALAAACLKHYIPGDFNLSTVADVNFYLSDSGSDVRR